MSKKHKQAQQQVTAVPGVHMHAAEYKIIKHDLIRVVYLNVLYLAGVLVLYFTNAKSHFLERWLAQVFQF
jgi:hypothetical protein